MPLRLRSAGGGSVLLKPPVALATDVSMEVPGYEGAKLLTDKTPGAVLQVVNMKYITQEAYTNTAAWAASGITATITPKFASSKILVLANVNGYMGSPSIYNMFALFRNNLLNLSTASYGFGVIYGSSGDRFGNVSHSFLDEPNTTSAVVYTVHRRVTGGTGYVNLNNEASALTLMEIAA